MSPAPPSRPWVIALACLGCVLVTAGVFLHHVQAHAGNQEPRFWVWPAAAVMSGFLAWLAIRGSGLAASAPAVFGGILVSGLTALILALTLSAGFA